MPGCAELGRTPMCAAHWALVSSEVKRRLVVAVKALRIHGQRKPNEEVFELFEQAITEVQTAQYKKGPSDEAKGFRFPAHLDQHAPVVVLRQVSTAGEQGGAAPAPEGGEGKLVALPSRDEVEKFGQS